MLADALASTALGALPNDENSSAILNPRVLLGTLSQGCSQAAGRVNAKGATQRIPGEADELASAVVKLRAVVARTIAEIKAMVGPAAPFPAMVSAWLEDFRRQLAA